MRLYCAQAEAVSRTEPVVAGPVVVVWRERIWTVSWRRPVRGVARTEERRVVRKRRNVVVSGLRILATVDCCRLLSSLSLFLFIVF